MSCEDTKNMSCEDTKNIGENNYLKRMKVKRTKNYNFVEVSLQSFPKQAHVFTCLQYKSLENTVGKGEIAHNEQYLLFPQCFLPFWITFRQFHQI